MECIACRAENGDRYWELQEEFKALPFQFHLNPKIATSQVAAVVIWISRGYLLDVKYLLSLDVPYKDIVRMIKLYAVWTVIVASAVAYLQNIKYQFSPHFSHPYPAKRPISHKNDDYFVVLPFAMRHASHPLFTGLRKIRVSMCHIADYICTAILIT